MNANGPGLYRGAVAGLRSFNCIRETVERGTSRVERSGDGCGEISRDSMFGEELAQRRQLRNRRPHKIDSGSAMHVNIEKSRGKDCISKVGD